MAGSVRNASQDFFRVHCPVPGPSRSDPPGVLPGKVDKICGGHGQGETPGPIPNPEAKALHGDGTAPERVWESSAPPHSTLDLLVESLGGFPEGPFFYSLGGSRRAQRPGNPHFFVSPASRPEHVARGAGRLVLFPVGSVCFGLPKGIFVIPQRLLVNRFFSERAFDTVYDTVF